MTEATKKPLRILLIEDSEEDTYFLLRELRNSSYGPMLLRVQTEESLQGALRSERWDLVLCDNSMPDLTGPKAWELVREQHPEIPFIFLSGADHAPKRIELSSVPFVQKGNRAALLAAIDRGLEGKGLPHATPASALEHPLSSPLPAAFGLPPSPKILMVDDRTANLDALSAVLGPLGSVLVRAESGEAALEQLLKEDFAVILLDVRMPGMGGLETADLIHKRARNRSVPIIFLTAGEDDPGDVVRGYHAGAVDYLTKPFVPEILKAKVSVFLELWRKNAILERQAAELRSANESLDAFTSSASHDLKVPLRAIEGFSRILCEEYEGKVLDPSGAEYARRITQAARRMKALMEDLIRFAHSGRSEPALTSLDLTDVVDTLLTDLSDEIDATQGQIMVERPLGKVLGQALLLRQALANLITNALKYAAPGRRPEIVIRAEPRGRSVRIRIEDRGIGISRAEQDKLFRPFVRLANAKGYPGTGLGLAIVKKAVERMAGQVGVESAPGSGSTFFIDLPCAPPDPSSG